MQLIRPITVTPSILTSNVVEADYPAYDATAVYPIGVYSMYNHVNYQSRVGVSHVVTISIASPAVVSWVAHGQTANTPVSFSTTGALPTGLLPGVAYFVSATGLVADSFQVSATIGGAVINTSGTQSGVHTAIASANFAQTPDVSPTYWLPVGATNRWSMFDTSVQSQTVNLQTVDVSILLPSRIDTVALINIDTASARVTLTDPVDGLVYDSGVVSGVETSGIVDMYTYFFEPIERIGDLLFKGLPPYGTGTIKVLLDAGGPAYTAACGGCVLGLALQIGDTEVGAKVGTQDYSVKTRDAFGNYNIVQRAFNKRGTFTITLDSKKVDKLQSVLADFRATPIVYIGSASYGASMVYGFYKSFEIEIGYIDGTSVCSLEVEGLV